MTKKIPTRVTLLTTGAKLTAGDRNETYGTPHTNFSNIAALWTAYLQQKYGISSTISPEDIAWLNTLQKMARTMSGVYTEDTYTDAAVYSAIAGEVAEIDQND